MAIINIIKILVTGKRDRKSQSKWRRAVIRKCGYRSWLSGKDENLEAHHIIPVNQFAFTASAVWNGVMLTDKEHTAYHRRFGNSLACNPFTFLAWASFHKLTGGAFL